MIIGSCAYMATERLGGKPGGPASDVYSLTCLLYECLTGRAPFEGGDLAQVMSAHMFFAAATAERRAAGDQPCIRRRRREGDGQESGRPVRVGRRAGQRGCRGRARTARARRGGRSDRTAAEHATVPGVRPEAEPDGLRAPAAARASRAGQAGTVQPDAGGAAGRDDRDARRGRRAGRGDRLHRGQRRLRTPEAAGRATPVDDDRHDDCAVAVRGIDGTVHHDDTSTTPSTRRPSRGLSARRRAGLRRARGALRRGQHAGGGDQDRERPWRWCARRRRAATTTTANACSDGANLQIANAMPVDGGFDATNPADGARYQVRPDELTISSSRGSETDPALEYGTG